MCSQKAVCLLVAEDLDHTIGVIVALGTTVGQQREGAHFVLHTLSEKQKLIQAICTVAALTFCAISKTTCMYVSLDTDHV